MLQLLLMTNEDKLMVICQVHKLHTRR